MFKVSHLTKKVPGKTILNHIDFEIGHGQIALFLGPSGVGKSTLLRVLNNLESYEEGTFHLDGEALDLKKVNQNHAMGMVFQHFNLFEHLTVIENVTLGLIKQKNKSKTEAEQIALPLLDQYGLMDKAGFSIHKLSGGQKQRLAIVRTVAMDPKIICFDEPTSALDPFLTRQVSRYIHELAKSNRIILVSTHDTKLIEYLEGLLFLMHEGMIVEKGSTGEYLQDSLQYPMIHQFLK